MLSNDYSAIDTASASKPATSVAPREKLFPKVQTKSSAGPARNADRGLANTAYLPDQDYDDADVSGSRFRGEIHKFTLGF